MIERVWRRARRNGSSISIRRGLVDSARADADALAHAARTARAGICRESLQANQLDELRPRGGALGTTNFTGEAG